MDIILLERIPRLGQMGDIVSVKDGYARNFLLPQGKALRANEANKNILKYSARNLKLVILNAKAKQRKLLKNLMVNLSLSCVQLVKQDNFTDLYQHVIFLKS